MNTPLVSELKFKDVEHYLTAEGYPLGTTCWYVSVEAGGWRDTCCADWPWEALRIAADFLEAVGNGQYDKWKEQESKRRQARWGGLRDDDLKRILLKLKEEV